jgi:transketolase
MSEPIALPQERILKLQQTARDIRLAVLEMIYTAQSGHIGGSFSAAEILAALYFDILRVRPNEPDWPDRDRFVISKGHACPVLYATLAMKGYFPMDTLKTLRQFESILQGHPVMKTPGIDINTGSLGVGFASAIGIALEAKRSGREYTVYVLLGDGEIQEGIVWEAASTARKYRLDNLVAIVDRNTIQNDGVVDEIMPIEPIDEKFRVFGWSAERIRGNELEEVLPAIERGRDHKGGPYCIVADTAKGKGVSFMENDRHWHGKPPDRQQYEAARAELLGGCR